MSTLQVIVNALGINDFHNSPPPPLIEDWADAYANFTSQVGHAGTEHSPPCRQRMSWATIAWWNMGHALMPCNLCTPGSHVMSKFSLALCTCFRTCPSSEVQGQGWTVLSALLGIWSNVWYGLASGGNMYRAALLYAS